MFAGLDLDETGLGRAGLGGYGSFAQQFGRLYRWRLQKLYGEDADQDNGERRCGPAWYRMEAKS